MTIYESLIKVRVHDDANTKLRDIREGLSWTVAMLMDEYGLDLDRVSDWLDDVRQEAEDHWYDLHPSDSEDPGDEAPVGPTTETEK